MKNAKWLIIFSVALLCSGFSNEETWIIDSESNLVIHGSTNVNTFACTLTSYAGNDTLRYFKNVTACKLQFTTNRMTVPIHNFNCGSKPITKDFWATLKSNTYPTLVIHFISLESITIKDNAVVKGAVDITLAGITSRYNIYFTTKHKDKTILLSGNQPVSFADFKLKAPEKFNGLIRVRDLLHVEFNLVLREVGRDGLCSKF